MPAFPQVRPQPQAASLNNEGQQGLAQLLQNDAPRKRLQARQRKAAQILQVAAGEVNDRAYHARLRHGNKLRRLEADGEVEPEEELDEYNLYQDQINDVTERLDLGVRGVIDDIDWLANLPDALQAVAAKAGAIAEETQRTQNTIAMTTQRSRRTVDDDDEDVDMQEDSEQPAVTQLDPLDAPSALLQAAFEKRTSIWNALSLTDKYAKSNEYKGFYTTIHDSKYPGQAGQDDVPVPHETMWFATEEGRQTENEVVSGVATGDADDDELQVDHVVIRIRCPFTLQIFKDPVTSKKCPHSFERSAFYDVLKTTDKHLPFTSEQVQELSYCKNRAERTRKEKEIGIVAVQCPECAKLLAEDDVERNPVLQRKAQRMVAEKQREKEADEGSEDEDEDLPRGTQRKPLGLGSSPPSRRASGRVRDVKAESGRVAQSPLPPGMQTTTAEDTTIINLGEEDDNGDMEDE